MYMFNRHITLEKEHDRYENKRKQIENSRSHTKTKEKTKIISKEEAQVSGLWTGGVIR